MHVELRPGEGGDDAATFTSELAAALVAYARRHHWTVTDVSTPDSRTVELNVTGNGVERLTAFAGAHRIQRVPAADRRGRRHTSTATVVVLPDRPTGPPPLVDMGECRVDRIRGHGPGGQHRNKVASSIRLTHYPTGIVLTRMAGRSQAENLASAQQELADKLAALRDERVHSRQQKQRRAQADSADRAAKMFTHNTQRDQVLDHRTGRTWTLRQWAQGRMD